MPQSRYSVFRPGLPAELEFDGLGERRFEGKVASRVPAANPDSRSTLVRFSFDNADEQVVPGMSARVRVSLAQSDAVVRVPAVALTRFPDGSAMVWVLDDGQRAQRVAVERRGTRAEDVLLSGLKPGQRVVVRGLDHLQPGQVVDGRPMTAK